MLLGESSIITIDKYKTIKKPMVAVLTPHLQVVATNCHISFIGYTKESNEFSNFLQ